MKNQRKWPARGQCPECNSENIKANLAGKFTCSQCGLVEKRGAFIQHQRRLAQNVVVRTALGIALALLAGPVLAATTATDGDTFRVGDERIRPVGYDAPEIFQPQCVAERMLGMIAKRRLQDLLDTGGEVVIERLPERDRYRRTLARVTVGGRDLAEMMVQDGLAVPMGTTRTMEWCEK